MKYRLYSTFVGATYFRYRGRIRSCKSQSVRLHALSNVGFCCGNKSALSNVNGQTRLTQHVMYTRKTAGSYCTMVYITASCFSQSAQTFITHQEEHYQTSGVRLYCLGQLALFCLISLFYFISKCCLVSVLDVCRRQVPTAVITIAFPVRGDSK